MSAPGDRSTPPARAPLAFGPFVLDPLRAELRRAGQVVALRRKTFDLLLALATRPGELVTKEVLLAAVWPGVVVGDDSLSQCVHELRAALGDAGADFVRTVPRRGYRFDAEVRTEPAPAPPTTHEPAVLARADGAPAASTPGPDFTAPAANPIGTSTHRSTLWFAALLLAAVIGLAVLAWQRARPAADPVAPALSIVLLPLEVPDSEETPSWFADALTADLTAELGRLASVVVISRDTAATWRGKPADPREVARALGVRFVVHGNVQRADQQVRLTLTLIDGESGAQQWAETFDVLRPRLGASLDDIVQQVARRLNVQMYRSGGRRAAALTPEQVQAEDLAMQGWGVYFRGWTRENFNAALPLFEQAVARDPQSIMGWGGVAIVNGMGAAMRWLPDREAAIQRLAFASARLQDLDTEHLFAMLARRHEANLRSDFEAQLLNAQLTVDRYPNHAPSHGDIALAHMNLGRFDGCIEPAQRAMRLSPRDPMLGVWNWLIGTCHFMRGEYREAVPSARAAGEVSPKLPLPPLLLAASLAREGQADEAREIVAAYRQRQPTYRAADIAKIMRSEHPLYAAGRARMIESLRELGMP